MDDDDAFRGALADNLQDDGYRVLAFAGVHELPPLADLSYVSAVVTDYDMPGTDGLAFADLFHGAHPSIPIIMVTAYSTPQLEADLATRGYLSLLRKPFDYDDLQALLGQLVAGSSTS
ncbi:MAG TPA: response regulator [Candidatus Kryptonia bacterium]|nr:response regulator [Candidatus Kryptonia bacterium]